MRKLLLLFVFISLTFNNITAETPKKVLIIVEGNYNLKQPATAEARELAALLGHFNVSYSFIGSNQLRANSINVYDFAFFLGNNPDYNLSGDAVESLQSFNKTFVWINTGFGSYLTKSGLFKQLGIASVHYKITSEFNLVKADNKIFTKGSEDINLVKIADTKKVKVLAYATSSKSKNQTPYLIHTGKVWYFADSPFESAIESDRYLYFSDILHDILGENHPVSHRAIVRIEDITPIDNPDRLRDIADILSQRDIPFLVGVVPIYVNPGDNRRVALSERPEVVDALKYMVQNGGTIVMHGTTHQYKGISTDDFEFWDGVARKPIEDEDAEDIDHKIETGLDEFMQNGIYPLLWETPHYAASALTYSIVAKHFSSAIEQRMSVELFDYGQTFPYIINKDLYGQRVYPENLGYVPLCPTNDSSIHVINRIINNSSYMLDVRDGIACFFFHSFLDLSLLNKLVDGITAKGFTWFDLRKETHWVKANNKIILTGKQSYTLQLDNSYLLETYFNPQGDIVKKVFSDKRINGPVSRSVNLNPGEFYVAQPFDYLPKELTFKDLIINEAKSFSKGISGEEKPWKIPIVSICWNQFARGAAYYDQASWASLFKSLNIPVDTIFIGSKFNISTTNLLVVPYSSVDSLTQYQRERVVKYVKKGGNIVLDKQTKLSKLLGFKFFESEVSVHQIIDRLYPQEYITWKFIERTPKIDNQSDDEIFCEDAGTGCPIVVGRPFEKGKILYFTIPFDPYSSLGYSHFPFAMNYIQSYLMLNPIIMRENLEFFFDPGLRQTTSIENLIKLWVKQGIRTIQVASWHQYPKYSYDYKRLIKLAHANGILVYAWIEPPQVNQKFWLAHPRWREKNYLAKDVRPSWRYPIALTDPACLKAVSSYYYRFLTSLDFDGVNVSELCFESNKGFDHPEMFTPMHHSAINEFSRLYQFDPRLLFDPNSEYYYKINPHAKELFIQYRIAKNSWLHDYFIKEMLAVKKNKPGFQIMLTNYDTYGSPELKEQVGISSDSIVFLANKYQLQLNVEDPANRWSESPDRYLAIGKEYRKKLNDPSKLFIDLNIMHIRNKNEITPFPTMLQSGVEVYQLINASSTNSSGTVIYSEATANPQDISMIPYASASMVRYKVVDGDYMITSPYSYTLHLPTETKVIEIDGTQVIGSRDNRFIVPSGSHQIRFMEQNIADFSTTSIQPEIISFTGNLISASYGMRKVTIDYESSSRALIAFNYKPSTLTIDGQQIACSPMKGNDCFTLFLPEGKHNAEILTGSPISYGINLTSLWSMSAIALYGTIAVIMLLIMYIGVKFVNRRKN